MEICQFGGPFFTATRVLLLWSVNICDQVQFPGKSCVERVFFCVLHSHSCNIWFFVIALSSVISHSRFICLQWTLINLFHKQYVLNYIYYKFPPIFYQISFQNDLSEVDQSNHLQVTASQLMNTFHFIWATKYGIFSNTLILYILFLLSSWRLRKNSKI